MTDSALFCFLVEDHVGQHQQRTQHETHQPDAPVGDLDQTFPQAPTVIPPGRYRDHQETDDDNPVSMRPPFHDSSIFLRRRRGENQ